MHETKLLTVITCLKENDIRIYDTRDSLTSFLNHDISWLVKASQYCTSDFTATLADGPNVEVIKCEDSGIYDGLNQAIDHCKSPYYVVFGAGDKAHPQGFKKASDFVRSRPDLDAFFFGITLSGGLCVTPNIDELPRRMSSPHPGCIIRTGISRDLGFYDRTYQIAADYDHVIRLVKHTRNFYQDPLPICSFLGGGISDQRWLEGFLEEELIRIRNYNSNYLAVMARMLSKSVGPIAEVIQRNLS